VKSLAY